MNDRLMRFLPAAGLRIVPLITTVLLVMATGTVASAASVEVVASGLANPRGIAVGPAGRLLIAEAGSGAPMTGHITELYRGRLRRWLNLPSTLVQGGTDVSGPTSVASFGGLGGMVITMGGGPGSPFGMMLGGNPGHAMFLADITGFELANNPDGVIPPDSNPYSVAIVDARSVLVADAAANDLLFVSGDGSIELVAVFPASPNVLFPSVGGPTAGGANQCDRGPDGAWYVGELRGFPFSNGSHIWRIEPGTRGAYCVIGATSGPCTDWASGLRHVVSIAFGPDGNLYASQFDLVQAQASFPDGRSRVQ